MAISETALRLTGKGASVCIAPVKPLLLLCSLLGLAACTTLENRRDLYRSPAEGYEKWYPQPPPTRKPAGPPVTTTTTTTTERHGVITFPEETALPDSGQ